MFCTKCGKQNADDANYCSGCGANIVLNEQVPQASQKHGDIKKCPSCGAMVTAFATKCSDCGHEFSGIKASNSITKLFEMLDKVALTPDTSGVFSKFVKKLSGSSTDSDIERRKKEIITNFPIPNTKEDILEFLAIAIPNAKKRGNFFTSGAFNTPANEANRIHNAFVPVWHSKCEQVILKAKLSMAEDKKMLEQIMDYAKEIK